jgi:hypothetical protein
VTNMAYMYIAWLFGHSACLSFCVIIVPAKATRYTFLNIKQDVITI